MKLGDMSNPPSVGIGSHLDSVPKKCPFLASWEQPVNAGTRLQGTALKKVLKGT
jgi:hypothetical protein